MATFLGAKNVCSSDLDYLSTNQFAPSKLYGKLLCLIGEINASVFKNTDTFKKLLGQDVFNVEYKGKDSFDAYNYAKVCIATNKLPETSDKTKGFYSKWVTIDFPNSFKENPYLLKTIPEIEYSNLAKKSCRILKELLAKGEFSNEGSSEDKERRYEERATPFKEFLSKECIVRPEYSVALWEISEAYQDYCSERNFRKPSKRELSVILENKGFLKEKIHIENKDGERSTKWVFNGLGLKENELVDTMDTKDTQIPTTTSYEKLTQKQVSIVSNVSKTETEPKLCSVCGVGRAIVQDGERFLCSVCWSLERGY
jgi:phage/plasmid-associated DNA primase